MSSNTSCLVLEGGALRGVYSAGVLTVLEENAMDFSALIGTSAGAMNALNFLALQSSRGFEIDYHYARDKNFMGLKPFLKEGQIFSYDYMFSEVAESYPLDYATLEENPTKFIAIATQLESGEPFFLEYKKQDLFQMIQATSSMPLLAKPVEIDGFHYLDGGPSMAVGVKKALDDGYEKIVLILTREKGYRKKPFKKLRRMTIDRKYKKYPRFCYALKHSPMRYNMLMDEIDRLEDAGKIFVIRPQKPVEVSRTERDLAKLEALYLDGKADGLKKIGQLRNYLEG